MAADEQGYSDNVYEVETGYHTHTDPNGRTKRLGPGGRFRPTKKQEDTGALQGKARMVERDTSTQFGGADIGVRALPLTDAALELALEHDLSEDDFEGVEPETAGGNFSKAQVEALVADGPEGDEPPADDEEEAPPGGETPIPDDFPHADLLRDAGLETLDEVAAVEDLTSISGIGEARAQEVAAALDAG